MTVLFCTILWYCLHFQWSICRIFRPRQMRKVRYLERSGSDYTLTQHHIPKERVSYLHSCENVKTRTWKVSSFSRDFYTVCFDMWYGWLPWLNVPECNLKLIYVSRTALFWVITQRVVLISCRRFGTNYRPHFQGSIIFWILQGVKNPISFGSLTPEDGPI